MNVHDALLSPKEYVSLALDLAQIPSGQKAPEVVIFVQQKVAFSYLLSQYPHFKGSGFLSRLAFFEEGKIAVCSGFGLGAPAIAARLEPLISWGVRRFIYVGVATILSSDIPLYEFVLPHKMRGSGLCQYFAHSKEGTEVSQGLQKSMHAFCSKEGIYPRPVIGVSSDFFLAPSHINSLEPAVGADVLDMDSAAFYIIAKDQEVEYLSLLVTSDCLCDEDWIASKKPEEVISQLKKAADLCYGFCQECID